MEQLAILENFDPELSERSIRSAGRRSRAITQLTVVAFVVIVSFAWGFVQGLKKPAPNAYATADITGYISREEMWPSRYRIPEGLRIRPFGKDIAVNGQEAYMVSFATNNSVKALLNEQVRIWEEDGFRAVGVAGEKRGTAIAFDNIGGVQLSMNAWKALPNSPGWLSGGKVVQGVLSAHTKNRADLAQDDEFRKQVPNIPIPDGTKRGSVFSSTDRGHRTYTTTFKVPMRVEDAQFFYRQEMEQDGWRAENGLRNEPEQANNSLMFSRDGREATFLFVPERSIRSATAVTLIVTPLSQGGAINSDF